MADERNDLLKAQGKMANERFESYMEEFRKQYNPKSHCVIAGWVEAETVAQQNACNKQSQDFLSESSTGMARYLDCAKLFFIHKNQMPIEWARKLDFKIRKIKDSAYSPSLAFILIYQPEKSSVDVSILKKIVPLVQAPSDGLHSSSQPSHRIVGGGQSSMMSSNQQYGQKDFGRSVSPNQAMKKHHMLEIQRENNGVKYPQNSAKHEFSTVYHDREHMAKDHHMHKAHYSSQQDLKHNPRLLFKRNEMEEEYPLPYNPESMYDEDHVMNYREEGHDYLKKPSLREDPWRTQSHEISTSQRMLPKSIGGGVDKRLFSQTGEDNDPHSRKWQQLRANGEHSQPSKFIQQKYDKLEHTNHFDKYKGSSQEQMKWPHSQKPVSFLDRTNLANDHVMHGHKPLKTSSNHFEDDRLNLSPYPRHKDRRMDASPMNYRSSQLNKSPRPTYQSMSQEEPTSFYQRQHASISPISKQQSYLSQSQSNIHSSQHLGHEHKRERPMYTRNLLEEDNIDFDNRTPKMHSQGFGRYEANRGIMGQKSNLHSNDLLNVPLKNLELSPTTNSNDLRFFQNRHVSQNQGRSYEQMNHSANYPSYKSNNYKANVKW